MPKTAAVLIAIGAVFLLAWAAIGIAFLGRLQGWQLGAGSLLGAIGAFLLVFGILIARRGKPARD